MFSYRVFAAATVCVALGIVSGVMVFRALAPATLAEMVSPASRMTRPAGMHPTAFQAYVRACKKARVHPFRLGQTLGDHPRSVGYHHRDGFYRLRGKKYEYSAAVDIAMNDLSPRQLRRLNGALAKQGFAAFYRHGKKWKGGEHIHAVYVPVKMKPQLRGQVREFLYKRRVAGLPRLRWERKLRHLYDG